MNGEKVAITVIRESLVLMGKQMTREDNGFMDHEKITKAMIQSSFETEVEVMREMVGGIEAADKDLIITEIEIGNEIDRQIIEEIIVEVIRPTGEDVAGVVKDF